MIAMKSNLNIESKSENLQLVEKHIDEICKENSVNEDYYGNILIAVTEAVNNAIHHGNKSNPSKMVFLETSTEEGKLFFMITDEGEGFDYDNLPDPTDPANIEKPHGRGVFLMKNLADEVDFEDKGKIVKLGFNIK
jgi:serine/threonine-protein kinase RsbW